MHAEAFGAARSRYRLLGVPVDALTVDRATQRILDLAQDDRAHFVCVRDVNGVMECQRDPELMRIHHDASLVTPDGMPVVWWGRRCGREVERVYGPDLMESLCARGWRTGLRHFLCGGDTGIAERLRDTLRDRFPGIDIVGTHMPPFRLLRDDEFRALADAIRESKADVVWVGLSTPKQERFMARLARELDRGVLIGVGAAFDFLSGTKPQAPRWIQRSGTEWIFRLVTEPRRLWRRYLVNNSTFVYLLANEILRGRPREG